MPAHDDPDTMAPASGKGIGKEIAADLVTRAGFVTLMADTARDALNATTRRWDPTAKAWIEEPDFRTRTAMFFGLLAHMEGEPVKRILIEKRDQSRTADPQQMLDDSPALQRAAELMLTRAKNRTKRSPAKVAELAIED